jgi:hypothetical protein
MSDVASRDVQRFIDDLMNNPIFARAPDAEAAYVLALGAQRYRYRLTKGYAEEFARKVRQRVQWVEPSKCHVRLLNP